MNTYRSTNPPQRKESLVKGPLKDVLDEIEADRRGAQQVLLGQIILDQMTSDLPDQADDPQE